MRLTLEIFGESGRRTGQIAEEMIRLPESVNYETTERDDGSVGIEPDLITFSDALKLAAEHDDAPRDVHIGDWDNSEQ